MPQITVIIAAYNAAPYLAATIAGVRNQTLADWQLIVVNDGSTDATGAVADRLAASDARIQVIHQPNAGVSHARNKGIAALPTDGEFVGFLDADDVYQPGALALLLKTLQNVPDAAAAYGAARFINSEGDPVLSGQAQELSRHRTRVSGKRLVAVPLEVPTTFEMLVYRNFIWTPGQLLLRRSALERVGIFDVGLSGAEDWDVWTRLAATSDLVYVNEEVLDYRRHDSNVTRNNDKMRQGELKMRRQHAQSSAFSPEQHRVALRGYQLSERDFARQRRRFACQCLRRKQFLTAAKHLVHATILSTRSHIGAVL